MYRALCCAVALLVVGFTASFAQTTALDLNSPLYRDLTRWEERGLTPRLPNLRPYPADLVIKALATVEEKGGAADRASARRYREQLMPDFSLVFSMGSQVHSNLADHYLDIHGLFEGTMMLAPGLRANGYLKGISMYRPNGLVLPYGERTRDEAFEDTASLTVGGREILMRQVQYTDVSWVNEAFYLSAGITRSSFGPFWDDGAVLGSEAPHAGRVAMGMQTSWLSWVSTFLSLSASKNDGSGKYPEKYLVLQSFGFHPFDWLDFTFFESVVWGQRFDVSYLLPFRELFYVQSMVGFNDNSLVGLSFTFKLPGNLRLPLLAYVDDASFNDLLQLKFSQTKLKAAFQGGLTWTPELPVLRRLAFEYLAVMPYMYTQQAAKGIYDNSPGGEYLSAVNYYNYTHFGQNLGPSLEPNSQRFVLSAWLQPLSWLDVSFKATFLQHGDASSALGLSDRTSVQGTIFDDGYTADDAATYSSDLRFLTQAVLEHRLQLGLTLRAAGQGLGGFSVDAGYTFEQVWNERTQQGRNATNHYLTAGLDYRF